jgi:DNA-binding IclR family transcriptional regulator
LEGWVIEMGVGRAIKTSTNTLQKGLDVLFLLAQKNTPITVPDIAESLELPTSSLYRIVSILRQNGLVERINKEGHLVLGTRNLSLARGLDEQSALIKTANPVMKHLCELTNESVHLYALFGDKQICIDSVECSAPLRVTSSKGEMRPIHVGASGKVLLAFLPSKEREKLIVGMEMEKVATNATADLHFFREDLQIIRKKGYAHTRSEQIEGAEGVAAPIFDRLRHIVASLSLAGPEQRIGKKDLGELIELVRRSAERISNALPV